MPKEITHWRVAEEVTAALAGTPLGEATAAAPCCLLLGSVFPDVLFYSGGAGRTADSVGVADALHGLRGQDTYAYLRVLASVSREALPDPFLPAFWVGVTCHLRTDARFHPLVFHLTGNCHVGDGPARAGAIARHRRFEALLDLFFSPPGGYPRRYHLQRILRGLEVPLRDLLERVAPGDGEGPANPARVDAVIRALRNFARIQSLARHLFLCTGLHAVEGLFPRRVRAAVATFPTLRLRRFFPALHEPIPWRNPVTGEASSTRVADLFRETIRDAAGFCRAHAEHLFSRDAAGWDDRGPSLCYGLPGVTPEDARYFSYQPWFE